MPPSTRKKVVRLRQAQQALRLLELIGSCGMLFCVISINKTSSSVGWIIRLAPAVSLLHTFYGFYHFCRAATGRTAGSSASYMVFAAMMDIGLIPFFIFCALMSHADYSRNAYGWSTLFNTTQASYKIIYAFFLISVTVGSLLIVSLVLGVYLGLVFRKIAKLPPDMNPLEPNLTARPHKRNKSELTTEKHLTGTTADSTDNLMAGTRRVPFMHTRTDSADSLTLYNNSARQSRVDLGKEEMYRHSNLSYAGSAISRPASAVNPAPNARFAGAGLEQEKNPGRTSKASSWLSYLDFEGVPTTLSDEAEYNLDNEVKPPAPSRSPSPKPHRESKNWFTRSARNSQTNLPLPMTNISARNSQLSLSEPMPNSARPSMQEYRQNTYDALNANEGLVVPPLQPFPHKQRSREPLGMNPPSPLREQYQDENVSAHDQFSQNHNLSDSPMTPRPALADSNGNTGRPQQTSRPSSFVGTGGKSRFYGDLRNSMGPLHKPEDHKEDDVSSISASDYSRTRTMESDNSGNFQVHHDGEEDGGNYVTHSGTTSANWNGPRQASNSTGYDLNSGYAGLGAEFGKGMGRRREVSGKVAEEGRGAEAYYERPGKAEGWARFKGL
jgi:hypothetical protein